MNQINDPGVPPRGRLTALRIATGQESFPDRMVESNGHIHTCYSFSPYIPSGATLGVRRVGSRVVGSTGHDSIAATAKMTEATRILGMGSVTGFECRAFSDPGGPSATRELNNPDSTGIAYITVQAIPIPARAEVNVWLAPRRTARLERTLAMVEVASSILTGPGLAPFDPQTDVMSRPQYAADGGITERHLLAAMADALIDGFGRDEVLVKRPQGMGTGVPAKLVGILGDADNPHLTYGLLGVFKSEYLTSVYIQPTTDEHLTAKGAVTLADSVEAIVTYAYLDDVSTSPTGGKKTKKSEDDYFDKLLDAMAERGLWVVTYMPPRNTPQQLRRVRNLTTHHGMYKISRVDISQPR